MMNDFDPAESVPTTETEDKSGKRKRYDDSRLLDPWERYRVLIDMSKYFMDVLEMADRRTRFALLILGTLNALNFILVARPDLLGASGIRQEPMRGVALYLLVYAAISVFLFVQAVIALRPRATPLIVKEKGVDRRLRHFGAMMSQTADQYLDGWRQATIGMVNKELAFQLQLSARAAAEKYGAIGRLYAGLMLLVFMTAGMLIAIIVRVLMGSPTA